MDLILQDLRYAVRSLLKSPAVFIIATLSLAIGIAVNVTIWAAADILLFRPLPYPESDRIVQVWSDNPERNWDESSISVPDFADWRRDSKTLDLGAYAGGSYNLVDGDRPERVSGFRVSPSVLSILGTEPAIGRGFRVEEEEPGRNRVAILSDGFWRRRFGADSGVLNRAIRLDGAEYVVIGVLPSDFEFGYGIDLWTPLVIEGTEDRSSRFMEVLGRLKPGATLESANRELAEITKTLRERYPASNAGMGAHAIRLHDEIVEPQSRQAGIICIVAVTFVLLIACANVANLLLARSTARSRELAVRSALGAGRGRLVRQLLTESTVLGLTGGLLGVLLSIFGLRWFVSIIPADFPRLDQVALDGPVLLYAAVVSILAGVVAGVAPAVQITRNSLTETLKEGGRTGSMGLKHGRLRASLVVAEIALSLVLLISAGLLIKGALRINTTPLGFDPDQTLAFAVTMSGEQYPDTSQVMEVQGLLLDRLRSLPGVTQAGAVSRLPMDGGSGTYYHVEDQPIPPEGERPILQFRYATPGYFSTLRIGLARGRELDARDRVGSPPAIVINETLARRHWPSADPLGKRLVFTSGAYEIVGIVKDVREFGPEDPPPALAYFAALQRPARTLTYVLRTTGDPLGLVPAVRSEVGAVAPDLPAYATRTVRAVVDEETQGELIMPKLLGFFGAVALILAMIGVYGVMAYSVAQRTQELGIRRALGADGRDILRLVLRQSTMLTGIGAVIGLGLALASTRALSAFLLGVSAFDPLVFAGVTSALMLAAIGASLVPARRATAVDPLVALRRD
jgi:putative ABC transport system permease protein